MVEETQTEIAEQAPEKKQETLALTARPAYVRPFLCRRLLCGTPAVRTLTTCCLILWLAALRPALCVTPPVFCHNAFKR